MIDFENNNLNKQSELNEIEDKIKKLDDAIKVVDRYKDMKLK